MQKMTWESSIQCGLLLFAALFPTSSCANSPALSASPSTNWYGSDGDWSAITLRIGNPEQWVDVIPNTASSETWIVGAGGCDGNSLCTSSRGGVFNTTNSNTWRELGFYELGSDKELGNKAYADYGLDSLTLGSTGAKLESSIIGVVNSTGYTWLGFFGLGTVPGSFNGEAPLSAISSLVEKEGLIQSHSYGYTAGAKYRQKGVPNSLTLGGYDMERFVSHDVTFQLSPSQQPLMSVDAISVFSTTGSNNWTTPVQLVSPADRVDAIIDSSTSFLWLPPSVCDTFASTLGLTYNSSLNLYTYDANSSQRNVLRDSQLTFTITLSDHATSVERVNIVLPYDAFDLELTYPAIPNTTYGTEASSKFYFPLRQAESEAQYRLGRAFLQEAYLITDYERNTFSVHQAIHPINAISNTSIVAITRDSSNTFSGPPAIPKKLSTGAIVGVVIGAATVLVIVILGVFLICRRRKKRTPSSVSEKSTSSARDLSFFGRFRRHGNRSTPPQDTTGSTNYVAEVGADASHERFELPAPLGPAELESPSGTLTGSTENDSSATPNGISPYEYARQKMERQQAAASNLTAMSGGKTENDTSQVAHYRPSDFPSQDSDLVSPLESSIGSISRGLPSPMTPVFPTEGHAAPPSYQRINPAHVVYAGRIPSSVQLPEHVPKVIGRDGRTLQSEVSDPSTGPSEPSTLGSHYTENQDNDLYGDSGGNNYTEVSPVSNETGSGSGSNMIRDRSAPAQQLRDDAQLRRILDVRGDQTRLDGEDLVHVPQPAERRFSFEEEVISGTTL